MRGFLATVLSVIAAGVLLIAYGLLGTRAAAAPGTFQTAPGLIQYDARGQAYELRPVYPGDRVEVAYPAGGVRPVPVSYDPYVASAPEPALAAPIARRVTTTSAPRATTTRVVEREPKRDWKKTAMVIGGTTAAGAGLGAIFGGKKGALIGAAIGGGAGTLYEVQKK